MDKVWPRAWPFIKIKHRKLVKPNLQDINPAKVRAHPPSNNRKISIGKEGEKISLDFLVTAGEPDLRT